jgi:hypothetical protein
LRYDANKPALNHDWLAEPKLGSRGAILCVRPPSSSADFFDAAGFCHPPSSPQKMVVLNPNRDNVAAYPVKPTIAVVEIRRSDIPYANANEARPDSGIHID